MSQVAPLTGSRPLVVTKRAVLWVAFIAALAAAVAALVFGTVGLTRSLSSSVSTVNLVTSSGGAIFKYNDKYNLHYTPTGTIAFTLRAARLPQNIAAWVITGTVATILTEMALCLVIALLAWRMLNHRPFRRSFSRSVLAAGVILAVGGLIAQGAEALAGSETAAIVNRDNFTLWPVAGHFDPTWIVFGVVLMLVALAFEYGERLQNDSDGLV
jgi:hypothetical protein